MAKAINKTTISAEKKSFLLRGDLAVSTHFIIAGAIALIVWGFLNNCLNNNINLWDDIPYIRDNRLVKDISWNGIKEIFTTPVMGNYHPLTILSYAIEYNAVNLEPWQYHFDSLVLHILATLLVYWFVSLLTKRPLAAIVTALLFGLHPMHVEAVAWAAARKDVLYGAFYVAACICYVYYLRDNSGKKIMFYIVTLLLFICALLSKPVAVTLPVILLLIDQWERRTDWKKALIEKIPHFVLAIIFGIIAIKSQETAGAMDLHKVHYSIIERIALGSYAFITYLWKAITPTGLHCFYTYPEKVNDTLPYSYYAYPFIALALVFIVWKYARKNAAISLGLPFFIANILLLLQFIPVGDAIVAERYSYIPYTGLFFIAGWYLSQLYESRKNPTLKIVAIAGMITYIGLLGYAASERCKVWADDVSLWRDETEKEPETAIQAYNNLGYIYYGKYATTPNQAERQNYYDSAYYLINKAIALRPDFVNPYIALGDLQRSAGKYDDAKKNYKNGLKILPKESDLYIGLAVLYVVTKNMDSAGICFRKVLELKPTAEAHGNYANYLSMTGKDDSAIIEYGKAISLTKDNYVPYMNRGILLKKQNHWDEATRDLESALKINPDAGQVYYQRSFCDTQKHNLPLALQDVQKAISLGFNEADTAYYNYLKQANMR